MATVYLFAFLWQHIGNGDFSNYHTCTFPFQYLLGGNVKWFIQYKIGEIDCIINFTIHLMQLANRHQSNVRMCFYFILFITILSNIVLMLSSGISLTWSEIFDVFIRMGRLLLRCILISLLTFQ